MNSKTIINKIRQTSIGAKGIVVVIISLLLTALSCSVSQPSENNEKEIKASEIIKMIKKGKAVQLVNTIIWDDLDFSSLDSPYFVTGTNMAVDVNVPLYFRKCVFLGKVVSKSRSKVNDKVMLISNFRRPVTFVDCDFRDEVDFTKATFDDNIDFSQSVFREEAKFNMCQMRGDMNRMYEIDAENSFEMIASHIYGSLTLMDAKFRKGLSLQSLQCFDLIINNVNVPNGNFVLSDATIRGTTSANYMDIQGDMNTTYTKFNGNVTMANTRILGHLDISYNIFRSPVKFVDSHIGKASADQCVFLVPPAITGLSVTDSVGTVAKIHVVREEHIEVNFLKWNEEMEGSGIINKGKLDE